MLTSSDSGAFGTNTPMYFATDNLTVAPVPEPAALALALAGVAAAVGFARRRRSGRRPFRRESTTSQFQGGTAGFVN